MEESLLDPIIDQIRPVSYRAEKLDDEFKRLMAIMKNPDPEKWDERERSLKRLAGMAMAHEVEDEEFLKQLRLLRTALATQVEDLRSSIVRTAAAACVILNNEIFPGFITVFEGLLPSFVRQLAVKAIPTRESSHECIARITAGHPNDRILKLLVGYFEDKDKIIRTRVSQFVRGLCAQWPLEDQQRNIRTILAYLKDAIGDGDSNVRANARNAAALLGENFPTAIAQFYRNLSDAKQKKELHKVLPGSVVALIASVQSAGVLDAMPSSPNVGASRRSTGIPLQVPAKGRVGRASVGGTPSNNAPLKSFASLPPRSSRLSTSHPEGLVPKLGPGRGRTASQPPMAIARDNNSNNNHDANSGGGGGGGSGAGSGASSPPAVNPRARPIRVRSSIGSGLPPSARMRRQSDIGVGGNAPVKQNSIPTEKKLQQARALADFGGVDVGGGKLGVGGEGAVGAGAGAGGDKRPKRALSEATPQVQIDSPFDTDALLKRLQALREEVNKM